MEFDTILEWADKKIAKYRAINECPECGSWTDRKVNRAGRTTATYLCSECGWNE